MQLKISWKFHVAAPHTASVNHKSTNLRSASHYNLQSDAENYKVRLSAQA